LSHSSKGFIYATTGEQYTILARRSARNLRAVMPDAQIDLFTDQSVDDPVFNQIHRLKDSWFRPRMQALSHSRFYRTIVLDADLIVVGDIAELFDAVDRCDLAASISTGRPPLMYRSQPEIPRNFPYVNAGMMVVKRTRRMMSLLLEWDHMMRANGLRKDQPALRWLLFHRRVPFQVLAQEYNLVNLDLLRMWEPHYGAPRVLHVQALHKSPPGDPNTPFELESVLGPDQLAAILNRQAAEVKQAADVPSGKANPTGRPPSRRARLRLLILASRRHYGHMFQHLLANLKGR
jgi:hypothetical protein